MIISGIDYSMTCPCVCVFDTSREFNFKNCSVMYLTENKRYVGTFGSNITGIHYSKKTNQIERFEGIAKWAHSNVNNSSQIIIEDYSMGSRGKVFHIAENTAILKYFFHLHKNKWITLPPTKLKKFATGKGNSDKNKMYEQFKKEYNIDLKKIFKFNGKKICSPISDIVDSFYLTKYLNQNPISEQIENDQKI